MEFFNIRKGMKQYRFKKLKPDVLRMLKKERDPWESNRIYEVRVYDPDMNLKYIISPEEVQKRSWANFSKQTKWHKKIKDEYTIHEKGKKL